jgi:hypothetical protein
MQFSKTFDGVMEGRKTQTRRKIPNDCTVMLDGSRNVCTVFSRGRAVQRGRGRPSEGRIRITQIRRQSVREISEEDAVAEGMKCRPLTDPIFAPGAVEWHSPLGWCSSARQAFSVLWDSIHGHGSFERDECFALTFKLVRDELERRGVVRPDEDDREDGERWDGQA